MSPSFTPTEVSEHAVLHRALVGPVRALDLKGLPLRLSTVPTLASPSRRWRSQKRQNLVEVRWTTHLRLSRDRFAAMKLLVAAGGAAGRAEAVPASVRNLIEGASEVLVVAPTLPTRLELTSVGDGQSA